MSAGVLPMAADTGVNGVALGVLIVLFGIVTVAGFLASRFKRGDGLESRRKSEQRSHSAVSPIARAVSASSARHVRNPRLGSCSHGTGP